MTSASQPPGRRRRVLVTGASGGIGRAVALRLAADGLDVAAHYRDRAADAERVVAKVQELGRRAVAVRGDVSTSGGASAVVRESVAQLGGLDALVLCAGGVVSPASPVAETTDEDWLRSINVNLNGVFYCCRAAVPLMGKGGRIVAISASTSAFVGRRDLAHYAASKAGAVALVKSLAREVASLGITANCVAAGLIETPAMRANEAAGKGGDQLNIPLGRVGLPEDVAGAVSFVISTDGDYMTGQVIHVNGGAEMI